MTDETDQMRQAVGGAAVEYMDLLDDDLLQAVTEFMPQLQAMVRALADWDPFKRSAFVIGMVLAALEADR